MFGSILSGIGAIAGAFGGSKGTKAQTVSNWDMMPSPVKDAYLKDYLSQVLSYNKLPFQAIPMKRAQAPGSIFDSQALWELQQYSDQMGGYFNPLKGFTPQQNTAVDPEAEKQKQQQMANEQAARLFLATGRVPGQMGGAPVAQRNMRSYYSQYQTPEQIQELGRMLMGGEILRGGTRISPPKGA